jgi:hypothetical protein
MKRLHFFQQKLIVFYLKAFENKKVTIFELAITNCRRSTGEMAERSNLRS